MNRARLRARARRLCGAPPLGCPLPSASAQSDWDVSRQGQTRSTRPRSIAPGEPPCGGSWRSSARPASTSAITASSSAIHSFSISRPGYPASAEAGSGPRAPTSTAIRNSSGCGRSSTSARPRSPRWAGCRRRSARCDISTIAPSTRSAAISEPYSTRCPGAFVEPFMSAPSPGILAMAVRNEYYDTLEAYLAALDAAAFVPHGRAAPRTHGQRSKPA